MLVEPEYPEEGDWVTSDYKTWAEQGGRGRLVVGDDETWQEALNARMERDGFYPNAWWCSDHGNWLLLTWEGK